MFISSAKINFAKSEFHVRYSMKHLLRGKTKVGVCSCVMSLKTSSKEAFLFVGCVFCIFCKLAPDFALRMGRSAVAI